MIRIVITIKEESPGAIRCRAAGEDVGGDPSALEVFFAKEVMKAASTAAQGKFKKTDSFIPLTFVEEMRKPDEHKDRN